MENNSDIEDIKKRLEFLENKFKQQEFILAPEALDGEVMSRSYRAHKNAMDAFSKALSSDKLKAYSVQDLVSQALWEFAIKYSD